MIKNSKESVSATALASMAFCPASVNKSHKVSKAQATRIEKGNREHLTFSATLQRDPCLKVGEPAVKPPVAVPFNSASLVHIVLGLCFLTILIARAVK